MFLWLHPRYAGDGSLWGRGSFSDRYVSVDDSLLPGDAWVAMGQGKAGFASDLATRTMQHKVILQKSMGQRMNVLT